MMLGLLDTTLILIYLLPVLGLFLGMIPAFLVWHFSKPRRYKAPPHSVSSAVNSEFTLSL
ncbi:hypothetical protein GCM10008111_20850 [Alishewanella tabrizica]|uniref:Uncharacterized protein n=1 Tax=Alishewanella tabrizica TaxID=671278 RepID=A0ABQ2WNK3_9ALTE|nr:hypothetical protein GCM10008111_20850 [Alishewanella tabrizica]